MNLNQLEYIIAVDQHRHFVTAAESCHVTQATLSMMIRKLEDELGVKIFDRSRQPVVPTREGALILIKARQIIAESTSLRSYAKELKGEVSGELHLGIIPTLAPYLLPLFLKPFNKKYPALQIFIKELITEDIIDKLRSGALDIGILASPLNEANITEVPVFYEEFYAYASQNEKISRKKYLLPREISINHLWLLEEGHCMRNQVFDLCELKKQDKTSDGIHYEAGSIETLINLVDTNGGITIIPKLAALMLKSVQKKNVREFASPKPVREIILATAKHYPRKKMLDFIKEEIIKSIPAEMLQVKKKLQL